VNLVAWLLGMALAVDAGVAPDPCTNWRQGFVDGLVALRDKYPELASFEPKSHVHYVEEPLNWWIDFDHHIQRRVDGERGAKRGLLRGRHVLRGADALGFGIEFFAKRMVDDLQHLHIFDGSRCGDAYEIHIRAADAGREAQLRADLRKLLATDAMPEISSERSPAPVSHAVKERNEFSCGVQVSSARGDWRRAVDGRKDTGWCPSAADMRRELKVAFCEPVISSRIEVVTDRGPLVFDGDAHGTELRLNDIIIPLELAGPKSAGGSTPEVLQGRGQMIEELVVKLPPSGKGRDRCLQELVVEHYRPMP
jgi:hypothetical protein